MGCNLLTKSSPVHQGAHSNQNLIFLDEKRINKTLNMDFDTPIITCNLSSMSAFNIPQQHFHELDYKPDEEEVTLIDVQQQRPRQLLLASCISKQKKMYQVRFLRRN